MREFIIIMFSFLTLTAIGQDSNKNNLKGSYQDKYKNLIHICIGLQKSFYTEIGICKQKVKPLANSYRSSTYLVAFDWTPTIKPDKGKNLYGLKIGYEYTKYAAAFAIDLKYHTDLYYYDFVVTPKLGFGGQSFCVFYGYNFFYNESKFPNIGHHQLSIICNFSSLLFCKYKGGPRGNS